MTMAPTLTTLRGSLYGLVPEALAFRAVQIRGPRLNGVSRQPDMLTYRGELNA